MKENIKPNFLYIVLFVLTLLAELAIALFAKGMIRGFLGDIFVIMLIYFFIKSFLNVRIQFLALYIFIFAVIIEVTQYFHIVDILGIKNRAVRIILGNTFDIKDIFAYFVGTLVIFALDFFLYKYIQKK